MESADHGMERNNECFIVVVKFLEKIINQQIKRNKSDRRYCFIIKKKSDE